MSGDADQEYFSDGIAEDIITELSRNNTLLVIARSSSFKYKGQAADAKQISGELGVRYLLHGSVQRGGERLRISAHLVDAVTGNHIWAERFDRSISDLFSVQDEITRAVAAAIEPAIAHAERQRSVRKPPETLDAWEAYQRALWHLSKGTDEGRTRARESLERSLALDPLFADAYAARSAIFRDTRERDRGWGAQDSLKQAEADARKALELAPDNPVALAALAWAVFHGRREDMDEALSLADRAIAVGPNYAGGHMAKAHVLVFTGRADAAPSALETTLRLDPQGPDAIAALHHIAVGHYFARNYTAAEQAARRTLRDHPDFPRSRLLLASILGQLGRTVEAQDALSRARAASPTYFNTVVSGRLPWYGQQDYDHLIEGLSKAGWQG
jgi:adenylate cyclase